MRKKEKKKERKVVGEGGRVGMRKNKSELEIATWMFNREKENREQEEEEDDYCIKKRIKMFALVTRPFYESRVNWVIDPAPPASRRPTTEVSPVPTPAILMPSSGASSQPPRRQKSRRRRRRKAARAANKNSASRQADLATPAALSANRNSAHWRATQPGSAANDRPEMRSTSVEHPHSFILSPLTQLPIPMANQNSGSASRQDHSEIWGLYKPAQTHPRSLDLLS